MRPPRNPATPVWPKRVRVGLVLALALSAAGLWALAYILPSRGHILESVRRVPPSYLWVALLLVVGSWLCDALRLSTLAATFGHRLALGVALRGVLAGNFMINVTPFYLGAGLVHTAVLRRQRASWSLATAIVAGGGIIANAVQLGLAWLAVAARMALGVPVVPGPPLAYAALGLYTVVYGGVLVLLLRVKDLEDRLLPHVGRRYLGSLARVGVETARGWARLRANRARALLHTVWWSLAYFICFHSVAYVLWQGLGVPLPWTTVIMLQILLFALFSVVPTPGGSGAMELGTFTVLSAVACPESAGAFVVLWRSFTFYLNLLVGWAALAGAFAGRPDAERPAG